MKMNKIYQDLVNLAGPSGYEDAVRKYVKDYFLEITDNVVLDKIGGVAAIKKGKEGAPVFMICGHMDEVGLLITGVTDRGMLKVHALGQIMPEVLYSQQVEIHTKKGIIRGVIGSVPPHLGGNKEKKPEISDFLVDIGADNKEEVQKIGVMPGDFAVFVNNYTELKDGSRIVSKAWDDRWGLGLTMEIFKELFNEDLDCTLICAASVQEEVGLRGAGTLAQMLKPDFFLALDASPVKGAKSTSNAYGELGKGFLLRLQDPANIKLPGIKDFFIEVAEKNKIKYQDFFSKGSTDAAKALISNNGILATTLGLPARYIHSTSIIIDTNDHFQAKAMVRELVLAFNQKSLKQIRGF
ncbi:MAG: hypothetical protein FWE36_07475 [Erysipelotrichales bacterium]|nr:hypothetical protein [Erysipelotrichales bacterium]